MVKSKSNVAVEFDWKPKLPVSRGGWVVVEEGEHVQLEGVVLLPDSNRDENMIHELWEM